jgi:hypothetical protein
MLRRKEKFEMGRYLVLWEEEPAHTSADVQERLAMLNTCAPGVQKGLDSGMIKEWGAMLGIHKGFGVYEGSEVEVAAFLQQFAPWFRSEVHAVLSMAELGQVFAQ